MSDESEHEMTATATVPTNTELGENGLRATQQIDFKVEKWVCSCGETWDRDEREEAEQHLRENGYE